MSNYIHGSSSTEQERLTRLNDLINRPCLDSLTKARRTCFDVGSGLDSLRSLWQKKWDTGGKACIERDKNQLKAPFKIWKTQKPWVEFRQGKMQRTGVTARGMGTFDVSHAICVGHVHQPERPLGMAKAIRPGESSLADDDHMSLACIPNPWVFPIFGKPTSVVHRLGMIRLSAEEWYRYYIRPDFVASQQRCVFW